jgi:hypothetical protein
MLHFYHNFYNFFKLTSWAHENRFNKLFLNYLIFLVKGSDQRVNDNVIEYR